MCGNTEGLFCLFCTLERVKQFEQTSSITRFIAEEFGPLDFAQCCTSQGQKHHYNKGKNDDHQDK